MLQAKAQEIAAALEHWQVDPDCAYPALVHLKRPDLPEVGIRLRVYNGRISITGKFPPYSVPAQPPRITVSRERDGAAIAADIKRRFLPDYITALSQALREERQAQEQIVQQNAQLDTLAEGLGCAVTQYVERNCQGSIIHYTRDKGRIKLRPMYNGQIEVEIRATGGLELALEFCALMR